MSNCLNKMKYKLRKSSPTILTGLSVIGLVGTAVMAVKATPKALMMIEEEKKERANDIISKKDAVAAAWECYIPTAIVGVSTIACIVGINALNKRNQASLASAYAMLCESYKQYRNAAKAVYGEDADNKIKAEIAKETYISADGIHIYTADMDPESEKILCYDFFSRRYFETTMAAVLNAQYHINRNLQLRGDSSINEFYEFLGLSPIDNGDEIGWSLEELFEGGTMWLDFDNRRTLMDDGLECCIISAVYEPNKFEFDE